MDERKVLEDFGCKDIKYDSLVNNYYIKFTYNEKEYIIEHILNVYGAYVDFWELCDSSRKSFNTLEEYFITDYESDVGLKCSEYSNLNELNEMVQELEDATKGDYDKLEAVMEKYFTGDNIQEIIDAMESCDVEFLKGWTAVEYEQDLVEGCYDLSFMKDGWLSQYIEIDYERMADDDDSIYETDKGLLLDRR